MTTSHAAKWTAFYLSLAVPGAGQLWAGSAWCGPWWLAVALTVWAWSVAAADGDAGWIARTACLGILSVLSAELARRLVEVKGPERLAPAVITKVRLAPRCRRRVISSIEAVVPASVDAVWARVADVPRFLTIDPFHERVTLMRPETAAGVDLVLAHNAFGHRFYRWGRILQWRPGQGYAFSDLSLRGPQYGFPHVFFLELEPMALDGQEATRLTITVRGRWSSRWIPVTLGRWWVYAVMCDHARLLRKAL